MIRCAPKPGHESWYDRCEPRLWLTQTARSPRISEVIAFFTKCGPYLTRISVKHGRNERNMERGPDKIIIKGVEIYLIDPPEVDVEWVGMKEPLTQLLAAWSDDGSDPPMQPRILGKPGSARPPSPLPRPK